MTKGQEHWLNWLKKHGGSGHVDRYGRVVAGGEVSPQGALICWIHLVAEGAVWGDHGRLHGTGRVLRVGDKFRMSIQLINLLNKQEQEDEIVLVTLVDIQTLEDGTKHLIVGT